MVTRKPVPADATTDPSKQVQAQTGDMRQEAGPPVDDENAQRAWGDEPRRASPAGSGQSVPAGLPQDIPDALRPGNPRASAEFEQEEGNVWAEPELKADAAAKERIQHVPSLLKPGPRGGAPQQQETNPFKRKPIAAGSQEATTVPPVPTSTPPAAGLSQLSLNETSNNPWQPALDESRASPAPAPVPLTQSISDQDSGRDAWSSREASRQASRKASPGRVGGSPTLLSLGSEEEGSAAWAEVSVPQKPGTTGPPAPIGATNEELFEDSHAWDDVSGRDKGKAPVKPPVILRTEPTGEGWNLIDEPAPGQLSKQSTWENFVDADQQQQSSIPARNSQEQEPPALPPRSSSEAPPPPPPRPAGDKNETYQIKNINWYDAKATKNPRVSPILVQNANGPCPLVALVNALTLTTPAGTDTALVETLRSREQVSLGLLLDAVFDELMSSRRTTEDSELPDVTELYAFLKGLHTGMNVNPRFIPTPETVTAFKRTSLTHLHPTERGDLIPGTFEDTKEMKLYSTFAVPLIHGWIPPRTEPVYEALGRRAESYEDVQNLLFREEELEEKLSNPVHTGLSEEEQEIYQDILTIKSFLSISATQLTAWGLEVIGKAMHPGSIAILFRNDHFSTLYRHPQTLDLLALVTDAGYAGHAEIIWESLVDVNGEHSEFFSGDFRLVGGAHHQSGSRASSSIINEDDWPSVGGSSVNSGQWQTAQGRRNRKPNSDDPPLSPAHEQEDRDLALALQLQEEEDERQRLEEVRRQRERQLSEQFIEQQALQSGPNSNMRGRGGVRGGPVRGRVGQAGMLASPRRSSSGVAIPVTTTNVRGRAASVSSVNRGRGGRILQNVQNVRPLVPPAERTTNRPADDDSDDAPPSYEHAAKQAPYTPPTGHPSHPASSPASSSNNVAGPSQPPAPPPVVISPQRTNTGNSSLGRGYRQGVPPPVGSTAVGKERDCVVM